MTTFIKLKFETCAHPLYLNINQIICLKRNKDGITFDIDHIHSIHGGLNFKIDKNKDAIEQLKQYGVIL